MKNILKNVLRTVGVAVFGTVVFFTMTSSIKAMSDDERAAQIRAIEAEAAVLTPGCEGSHCLPVGPTLDELASKYGITRNSGKESRGAALMATIYSDHRYTYERDIKQAQVYDAILFFISYDYGTTADLGAGERAGVLSSYQSWRGLTHGNQGGGIIIPTLKSSWENVIKIANGRWPSENFRNSAYEEDMENKFREIYLRGPNRDNPNDDAAVMTIAYGLRPQPRNVGSESTAIGFFKGIYNRDPSSASDWDIVRAIAYSGATR